MILSGANILEGQKSLACTKEFLLPGKGAVGQAFIIHYTPKKLPPCHSSSNPNRSGNRSSIPSFRIGVGSPNLTIADRTSGTKVSSAGSRPPPFGERCHPLVVKVGIKPRIPQSHMKTSLPFQSGYNGSGISNTNQSCWYGGFPISTIQKKACHSSSNLRSGNGSSNRPSPQFEQKL
ncbi:hypothetical protein H6P81_003312 [Aristolochia fimbriata]|uniref:Uncharacterized protein n=1 Tax=Aristolochia fimbriata TaxID=158543 RepID=A0AAV7FCS4_ARIFI|nr:hypothetical protein H6P81_003312 [Aristolochia fimbriata]